MRRPQSVPSRLFAAAGDTAGWDHNEHTQSGPGLRQRLGLLRRSGSDDVEKEALADALDEVARGLLPAPSALLAAGFSSAQSAQATRLRDRQRGHPDHQKSSSLGSRFFRIPSGVSQKAARPPKPEGLKDAIWVIIIATILKVLLIPAYRSTDFEVHRNWLALTHSLPMHKWYFEDTSEWTLDYPPFFAYFEWGLSQIAQFVDPNMLVVKNLGYDSFSTVVFQRLTVILSEFTLIVGIVLWSQTWTARRLTECAHSRGKVAVITGSIIFNPGLLFVDHIHFQYNGLLLGLLLISVSLLRMERNLMALAVFCLLLLMKHIFAYVVPVFGIYLLGHYCWTRPSVVSKKSVIRRCQSVSVSSEDDVSGTGASAIKTRERSLSEDIRIHVSEGHFKFGNFLVLVGISLLALVFAFGPIIISAVAARVSESAGNGRDLMVILQTNLDPRVVWEVSKVQISQILSRLFPWGRGLCHAYWAPNVWAWYVLLDKIVRRAVRVLKIPTMVHFASGNNTAAAAFTGGLVQVESLIMLPNIRPPHTFLLTAIAMIPVLRSVWKFPHPLAFAHAVVYCQICSFMLGYHVHEKAILMAIIPMGMMAADSVDDAKLYLMLSWIGNFSLFPLLHKPREVPLKVMVMGIHMILSYLSLDRYHRSEQKALRIRQSERGVRFTFMERLYLVGMLPLFIFVEFGHPLLMKNKLPFLPLLLMSTYCALGLVYVWHLAHRQVSGYV